MPEFSLDKLLAKGFEPLFLLGLAWWIVLFRILYSPRAKTLWVIEAVARVVAGSILGAVVAFLLGYGGVAVTGAAWLAGGFAVALSRPRA